MLREITETAAISNLPNVVHFMREFRSRDCQLHQSCHDRICRGSCLPGRSDPRFGANVVRYYEYLRENDLCLTHTLIPPQANRAVSSSKQADPFLAARIKEETDAGLIIRGCRMLATLPISDEIMISHRRC